MIRRVAFLSIHSSPLTPPGSGDAGGMNVYVDSLARTLAARGIAVDVFTRRLDPIVADETAVIPGYCVIQIDAVGEERADLIGSFAEGVVKWAADHEAAYDVIHSHYWLS
ncbi:MAG TPA: glycosyltransferase, partial [Acidimicrobiia bacterium]